MFSNAYDTSRQYKIFQFLGLSLIFLCFFFLLMGCYLGYRKAHQTLQTNKTVQTIIRTALIVSGNSNQFNQIGPLPLQNIIHGASGNIYQLNSGALLSVYVQADDTFMIQLQNLPYYICENIVLSQVIPSFAYEGGKDLHISATPTLSELCGKQKHLRVSLGLLFNKHLSDSQQENLKLSLFKAFQKIPPSSSLFFP